MNRAVGFLAIAVVAAVGATVVVCRANAKTDEKPSIAPVANDKAEILTINLVETNATQTVSTVPPPTCIKPPYKVALIVQNHTSDAPTLPMSAFADTLTARLSGKMFRIVNPHNVIGTNQNRTAKGEEMPEASALNRLSHDPDLAGVITASIQEFTGEDEFEGDVLMGHTLRVRLALNFMDSTGGNVFGIDDVKDSRFYSAKKVKSDTATLYEGLMHQAAAKAATALLAKDELKDWTPAKSNLIDVFFDCNVLGADVQVDGMSYGTTPAKLALTPGAHNLLISYPPYYFEYKRRAVFNQKGQRYNVVLQLAENGEAQRDRVLEYAKKLYELHALKKKDAFEYDKKKRMLDAEIAERAPLLKMRQEMLDAVIDRYIESGKTTDEVRIITAEGIAKYNGQSYQRIDITDGEMDGAGVSSPATGADDVVEPPSWSGIEKWAMKVLGM